MAIISKHETDKGVDSIQERLTSYARDLSYEAFPHSTIHAAKLRVIDTIGVLIGGFFGEPCQIARTVGAQMSSEDGCTIIGTRMKTMADMAAFVNGTTARYLEMNDGYHRAGLSAGHPSDSLGPLLSAAEYAQASGRDFITSVILAYEVHLRTVEAVDSLGGFDYTNFVCLATAVGVGKLLNLSHKQLSHCISMAIVPNNALAQSRTGHLSMFKATASGEAGRGGVFAAMLAQAGMEGPHLPFEGKAGWCEHVASRRYSLDVMGGGDHPFKINETMIKLRAAGGTAISSVMAAEKVPLHKNIKIVKQITVDAYKKAKEQLGTEAHHWNPDSKESADHSIPYIVAAVLMDGTITHRSFDDAHLWNPDLRALIQKVEVVENAEFTRAYAQYPVQHRTRITVTTIDGQQLVGETGGEHGDVSDPVSDGQIEEKFRLLTEETLGTKRAIAALDRLWHLEDVKNMALIPSDFSIE